MRDKPINLIYRAQTLVYECKPYFTRDKTSLSNVPRKPSLRAMNLAYRVHTLMYD